MGKGRPMWPSADRRGVARCGLALLAVVAVRGIAVAALSDESRQQEDMGFARDGTTGAMMEMMESSEYDDPPQPPRMAKMSASSMPKRGRVRSEQSLGSQMLDTKVDSFDGSTVGKMLVKTGRVSLETFLDVDQVASQVATELVAAGGFVERQNANNGWLDDSGERHGRSVSMSLRVPVDLFTKTMADLTARVEDVVSASEEARDVTADYVDAAARERTMDATRQQLLKLMESAYEVPNVLAVQRELNQVTQQIEAKKAVMLRLERSSSLSTIALEIRQKEKRSAPPVKPTWSIFRSYARAFVWLGRQVRSAVDVAVFASVALIPLSCLLGLFCAIFGTRQLTALKGLLSSSPKDADDGS